jgi:hypothetical protein
MSAGRIPSPTQYKLMNKDINKNIDALLQKRQTGVFDYTDSTQKLIELGVKIGNKSTGDLTIPANFGPYLDKYNTSNLEFEWTAKYTDGTILNQFEGDQEHNFSHIDQSKLAHIEFVSNFNWPTDNVEKRIIVRLNWTTGLFEIINGFASQDVKSKVCMEGFIGEKKLILFTRKRISRAQGKISEKFADLIPMMDEIFYYNCFVLGYESTETKKVVIIRPNGIIELFE